MDLITAIKTQASAAASAGNWATVAAAVQAITITAPARECFGVETADALDAVGDRRRAIMLALQNDPDGRYCLQKLASDGVLWAHRLTVKLMDGLISAGVMLAPDKAALIQLSSPTTFPFAAVSAAECQSAWQADHAQTIRESAWTAMDRFRNQIGTSEQAAGITSMRAMLDGLEE
jgi:hypothetical protein